MVNLRAVDVGFGGVKATAEGCRIEFPSVMAQFKPVRFSTGIESKDVTERLCLEYRGQRYFAGSYGRKQGIAQVTLSPGRFAKPEGMALLLTALALLSGDETDAVVKLTTGLPVSDYAGCRGEYEAALLGEHELKLLDPSGDVAGDFRVAISEVKIIPQPAGTLFHRILDRNGQLIDKLLAGGNVGILDIGANTVDLARFDQLDFIDSESESYSDLGMFECYKALAREIKTAHGIEIRPAEMESYVRGGMLSGGTLRPILNERRQVYKAQAEKIVSRTLNLWRDAWQFNRILLTGGGAAALGEFLLQELGDLSKQAEILPNSTFTNCSGYYKYGLRAWA